MDTQRTQQTRYQRGITFDMDSTSFSSGSIENANIDYANYYDVGYESSLFSEASTDEYFSFGDNSTITTNDSCFGEYDDNFSVDSRFYEETDSSLEDGKSGSYTTTFRSRPDSSLKPSLIGMKGLLT